MRILEVDSQRIIQLITKEMSWELTEAEQMLLNDWLNESINHQLLYQKIRAEGFVETRKAAMARFNADEAWEKVQLKATPEKSVPVHNKALWKAVSVAGSILIVIGIYWLLNTYSQVEKAVPLQVKEAIQPGANKAVLTLANGQSLELGENDTTIRLRNTQLTIDANRLSYRQDTRETSEIKYNTLRTPRGGEYQLCLADGTHVWLNADSELRYPEHFAANDRTVYVKGEAYFEVAPNSEKPFYVYSGDNRIRVLGTAFNIRAYGAGKADYVTLCEGSIALCSNGSSDILKPNQQAVISSDETVIKEVDAAQYTAWKDGMFMYRRATLELILADLSRWYNTNVFYTNQQIKYSEYSLYLKRYENITSILEMLEATGEISFKIDNNNIVVSPTQKN
ncbi:MULTISPECIES: FecR family protein [unclassified Carboxylicivirga]|uniref:FecR family protein n=1 Tax=Carboxylicivirga TaxID=1628153 RepID=UPI003D34603A